MGSLRAKPKIYHTGKWRLNSGRQGALGGFEFLYLLTHSSQSPSAVGTIQPKTMRGSVRRKKVLMVAGFMVRLGQAIIKPSPTNLKRIATIIQIAPSPKRKYAFISSRLYFFPLQDRGERDFCRSHAEERLFQKNLSQIARHPRLTRNAVHTKRTADET
jgi:hypothetical protein